MSTIIPPSKGYPIVVMTVGVPGCGKTTWANQMVDEWQEFGRTAVRSRDDYRRFYCEGFDLNKYKYTKQREKDITTKMTDDVVQCFQQGMSVIICDTNLNEKTRLHWVGVVEGIDSNLRIQRKVFNDVSLHTCYKRNLKRNDTVPTSVLVRMQKSMREYCGEYVQDVAQETAHGLPTAIICDLDGTLFHMNGRTAFEWDRVGEDTLDNEVRQYLHVMFYLNVKIFLFSGRDAVCRSQTETALVSAGVPYDLLDMRTEGSNTPDYVEKERMFDKHVKGQYRVLHVLDDRTMMCMFYEAMGLKVWNVGGFMSDF